MSNEEVDFYSFNYWFNNKEHDNWNQGGEQYYVNKFYDKIITKINDIPSNGKINKLIKILKNIKND